MFTGPPGTGKTEVARLYGRLLAAIGVLGSGQFVEAARGDLVAGWVGQTAQKTTAKFNEARGGVLFIDEAYALTPHDGPGNDFGREAVETLLKLMEDHRDEVVVIAAGYPTSMTQFLAHNPGLRSRFGRTITFPGYGADELMAIFARMAAVQEAICPQGTLDAVRARIETQRRDDSFGNGRYVRELLTAMSARQAVRLSGRTDLTREVLATLLPDDLPDE